MTNEKSSIKSYIEERVRTRCVQPMYKVLNKIEVEWCLRLKPAQGSHIGKQIAHVVHDRPLDVSKSSRASQKQRRSEFMYMTSTSTTNLYVAKDQLLASCSLNPPFTVAARPLGVRVFVTA